MTVDFRPADWPRIASLLDEALALDVQARPGWVDGLTLREPALAPHVQRLLQAHAQRETADWLQRGPQLDETWLEDGDSIDAHALAAGDRIGSYLLLERVARGGMGEVWRAEASAVPGGRMVAIKRPLLHRPHGTTAARFAREGAILASLDHPHIARLYDAGTAADGTPFLALEWVEGRPLTAWCDAQELDAKARLRVFLQVLDAVSYAQARLVLHRDLKPSNILVDTQGQVKLLDFGIAKLLTDDATGDATELTRAAGRVMTTAYAAPEQVRAQPLTPATDVYALGIVLFELLTGERPYRTRFESVAQLEQAIDAGDLRRPSELRHTLRGDVDAIVGKALQREPAQRYAHAAAMAEDLRRHLDGRPVSARPDSTAYVLGRFVRRHRSLSIAVAATVAALGLGLAASLLQAARAERERDRAIAAGRSAQATQQFLADLLGDAARAGQPLSVAELMQRAERLSRIELRDRPDELATVLALVGNDETTQRDPVRARALLEEAASVARDPSLKVRVGCGAAALAGQAGRTDEHLLRLRTVVDDASVADDARTACRLTLAKLLLQGGALAEAERHVDAAWPQLATPGAPWRERVWALTMQVYLRADGRARGLDASVAATLQPLAAQGRESNDLVLGLYNTWGTLAMVSGEPARAIERYGRVVQVLQAASAEATLPTYHLDMLASAHTAHGDLDRAAALLDRSLAQVGPTGPDRYRALCLRGRVAALADQPTLARRRFDEAAALPDGGEPLRRNAEPFCRMSDAESRLLAGDAGGARTALQPVLDQPQPASVRLAALLVQAEIELVLGHAPRAAELARSAEREARRLQADNRWSARTGQALALQALAMQGLGDGAAAGAAWLEARRHLEATVLPSHRWRRRVVEPMPNG